MLRTVCSFALAALTTASFVVDSNAQQRPRDHTHRIAESESKGAARSLAAFERAPQATANQADYDATYYVLDLDMNPTTQIVSGTVRADARVTAATLTTLDLDLLSNMTVTGVTSGGVGVAFSHAADVLTITLDRTYVTNEIVTVVVTYSGTPSAAVGSFGFSTWNGNPMIWSLSEPFGARSWWPCKDIPSDKADSVDVIITVPNTLTVASNGNLASTTPVAGSKTRFHWEERYPITTYLVSIAIHPYTQFSHWYHYSPTDSMEVAYYVFPDHYLAVQSTYALTVPMLETFAGLFGEYPFINEKYGHAEFTWGGGMEHQTLSSMGGWGEYLIAHEAAHQWWGDMITCDTFNHIWLNEGFATYAEALWSENQYGVATYHADMSAAKYLGPGTIYVPDTSDVGRIFHSGLSYNKGSWVLHMLRRVLGDTTFFNCLQTYYSSQYQHASATTEQFRDLCEGVSGIDLDWFFQQWIYEEYYPTYSYSWSKATGGPGWEISLTVDQLQTNTLFKMPIDIRVTTGSGDQTFVIWDSLATQSFTLGLTEEPLAVALDPDEWILRSVQEPISNPTFHRGVLVVNGVDFNVYGSEIWTAYEDSIFWGDNPITFWDGFPETGSGYPANVPAPIGHGAVPADTIKQFSTVVWVGNNYNGDAAYWHDTPILSYLDAGGNVLLLSRFGQEFITLPLQDYLGITWRESATNTINDCVATYPGLTNMVRIGTQSFTAVFDTALTQPESELLFKETTSFGTHRGLGVWRQPAGGGLHRTTGGHFAFVSSRPYRWNHDQYRGNVEEILLNLFDQPLIPVGAGTPGVPATVRLFTNYPNPFNPATTIRFSLPHKTRVGVEIFDAAGRLVRRIAPEVYGAGVNRIQWNGQNDAGAGVASGVYFYRLTAGTEVRTRKMVLVR